ncbi:type II toxin-antitoxin system RelE family toxin [Pseudanabaena galeata]|uniref:type II toxin-antitoxin system RelE family toxin n=1 Tax=Pseudanabaena TaxID=1152 RepID=UPI00387E7452
MPSFSASNSRYVKQQITPLSLFGNLSSFFKLRVGDYRVIYAIAQSQKSVIIHQVRHCREIYD